MQTISLEELHCFLLTQACIHTFTWLRALRWSPARSRLSGILRQAQALIPRIGTNTHVADEASALAHTIEMDGFGIGGITEFPSTLWSKEFSRNPWDYADRYPRMKRERVQILWEHWRNLRRDSFHRLTERVKQILRAIEFFDNPRSCGEPHYQGKLAKGYHARYRLTQQIAVPDTYGANGINMRAIRQATIVEWLHIENNERAEYDDDTLMHIREKAWEKDIRGIFFAQPLRDSSAKVTLCKPASDMRLLPWLPYDSWAPKCYSVPL